MTAPRMPALFLLVVFAALTATAACARDDGPGIAVGTYYSEDGVESLVVLRSAIHFRVRSPLPEEDRLIEREYPYSVSPDGAISFVVSSNDARALRLALDYRWVWREGRIARTDVESGRTVWFTAPGE